MSTSVNKVILIGNLGKAAEMRRTGSGEAVLNFSIACNESWKDKSGQKQERTEWVNCAYFGKGAEAVAQFLEKGKQVYIEGRLQTRQWEKDGQKRSATEVNVQSLKLLGGKSGGGGAREQSGGGDHGGSGGGGSYDDSDSIPF